MRRSFEHEYYQKVSVYSLLIAVIVPAVLCSCSGRSQMAEYDRPGFLLDKSTGIIVNQRKSRRDGMKTGMQIAIIYKSYGDISVE